MRNKFLPFLMLMALFAPWAAQAQETLTVYDGTSQSSYVPAYMSYFDDFSRSQFVIPASNLEVMGGGTISSIKFYTTDYNVPYTSVSTVDVYLMEVNYTTMTALEPKANGTIVYQGKLNVVTEGSGGSLTINFSTPYNYGGGNLLIGIENTTDTGYKFIYFYGQTVSGASWAGYNTSSLSNVTGSQQNFIPKTTFTYEAAASSCPRPTGLTVSNITTTGATFTWNGSSDSYVVMVKEAGQSESTNLTYDFEDGTSQGWTTLKGSNGTSPNNWMHISEYSYAYNYEAMSSGRGYNGSDGYMYSESYITGESQGAGTPVYPDNYLVSPQVRLGGSITFHAGGQNVSYCAEHFSLMVSTTGNDAINNFTTVQTWTFTPTASSGNEWQEFTVDLSAYSGMGYVAIHHFDCYDQWFLCIDDITIDTGEESAWITYPTSASPFTLNDAANINPGTTYDVKVIGICNGEESIASNTINFTTTIACPAPTNLAVTDITGHGATLTWEGSGESYLVSVGTYDYAATPTMGTLIEEDFEDGSMPTGWTHIGNGTGAPASSNAHGGSYSLKFNGATTDNVVVLPDCGTETNRLSISFWSKAEGSSSGNFDFGYVTDVTDASTFVSLATYSSTEHSSYQHIENYSMASAPAGARIAFRHRSGSTVWFWFIDDITINGPVYPMVWTDYTTEAETYTFTTLTPETYYEAKVQSNCGDDGMSAWSNTVNFTTEVACMSPTNLAATGIDAYSEMLTWEGNADSYNVRYITSVFYESFEEGLGDWTVYPGGDAGAIEWYVDDPSQSASLTAHSGNNVVWSFSDANVHASDWLVSPELDLGGTLKYWAMSEYQDAYEVKLSTTGIDTDDFTVTLRPLEASDITWTEVSIDLSAYEGQRGRIAFHHDHTGGFFLMIDDIGIYGWSEPMSTDSTSFALYDLDPETEYSWQVQASCGGEDGDSRWVEGSFTTGVSCDPPTGLELDESSITAHRAIVTWDAEEDVTFQYSFPNTYHPNINPETLTFTDIQGNSKTLTNLRADMDYGFYLRKNCGADGYSEIISVLFHTPEACPAPSNIDVANIYSHAATLTWEGTGESYNVMYGAVNTLGSYKFDNEVIPSNFTNGDTPWKIWEDNPNSGSYCIASDNYNEANSTATISLTATYEEDGTIEFYSRVSSESISYDYGTFFIDDVEKLREGGNSNTWMHYVYEVSAGEHTFIWNYRKDGGVNGGEDRYYIDDIILRTNSIEWITVNANDTICTLTGLTPETLYKAKVQSDCGSEGVSNESEVITFTTLENCPQPKDIEVSNVTRYTATVNWTGDSESFTVSYRMNGGYDIDFTEDFADETPVNYSATTYYLPEGWQSYNSNSTGYCPRVTNSSNYSYISTFGTGNNFLLLTTNDTGEYAYAIMPFYNNIADVQFNYAYENISNGTLTVGYVTNNTGYSTYTALQTMSATTISTHFTLSAADIATINNVNGYIAFRYQSGSSLFYSVGIDDIAILAGNLHNVSEWQSVVVTETTAYLTGLEASTKYDVKVIPSCDETNESDIVNFSTMDGNMKIFLTEGDWGDASNWMDEEMPTLADTAILRANATVTGVAEADQITFEGSSTLTIADGGQLKTNNDVLVTMKKNIAGYGTNNASTDYGYYLITAPTVSYWSAADYGLITADNLYDLYSWNRTATDEEWYNTKNNSSDFYMYNGMGYLYANENDVEMSFTYPVKNSTEPVVMTPEYDEVFKGWNLYGNPFPCDAYITTDAEGMTFYRLIGNELVPITGAIAPMEGFFVKATAAGQTFTISREAPGER